MELTQIRKPPRLRSGDRVRLVAPASPFARRLLRPGTGVLQGFGLQPLLGRGEFRALGHLAGTDEERAARLNAALTEGTSRAVWCIRGGYGSGRLLRLVKQPAPPKLVVGCSDVTALLLHLSRPGGWVTLHGPVVTQLGGQTGKAKKWLRRLLFDPAPAGRVPFERLRRLRGGRARGFLYGGNLALLASLCGTPYLPPLAGAILFVEEVNEPAYRVDRMWNQLKQAGVLENVFGVVIGSLSGCTPVRGRFSAGRVLEEEVAGLGVPAVSGASFGHQKENLALPEGVLAELDADRPALSLLDGVVS